MYTITDLYDLDHTIAKEYLKQFSYPWQALGGIRELILALGPQLGDEYDQPPIRGFEGVVLQQSPVLSLFCD